MRLRVLGLALLTIALIPVCNLNIGEEYEAR